jgi:ABC-type nitrate/sulfonate/bicarbonate transport system permease component
VSSPAPTQQRQRNRSWLAGVRYLIPPLFGFAALLVLWQLLSDAGVVKKYVVPSPTAIANATSDNWSVLLRHAGHTTEEALLGFVIGNAIAIGLAMLFVYSRLARRSLYPIALTSRAVPIVAIVPVLVLWLGNTMAPRIFIASVVVFFPTLINMVRGLRSVDAEVNELFDSLSASTWQRLVKVRLPASLPYLFAALKIGAASCFIGAVVAEWIGANVGLGYLIVVSGYEFRVPVLWAAIVVAAALTLAMFALVALLERFSLPWVAREGIAGSSK